MSKYMTKFNAANLLEHLGNKGFVTDQGVFNFVVDQQQGKELPLYLRILAGVGAFIASFCFIAFLLGSNIINFDHEKSLIICGLAFAAGAIGLQVVAGHTVKHSFIRHTHIARND